MTDSDEGRIVTFYSYKGGTGRTMALANTAWILASNGLKVLVIDWDLESPGLHRFFHPFIDSSIVSATSGVIEMITDYAWAALRASPRPSNWHLEYAKVLPHAVSLEWNHFGEGGTLDFISAGRQNRDYSSAVSSFDWDNFYERLGGGQFLDALRADMKRHYDYVLIDSRTGWSDIADICTVHFPDILVDCFTLSDQGIDGAAAVARRIDDRHHDRKIRIMPVPMRIDDGEKEKLDAGRAVARVKFDRFPSGLSLEEANQYWAAVEIPYKPFYAFEEILAMFGDAPGSPTSMLSAFERLTRAITDGRIQSFPPMDEGLRLRYRDAFARREPPTSAELFLSYVPEDRMWADWMESVLRSAGFRVLLRSAGSGAGTNIQAQTERNVEAASRTIAVLSATYLRSPQARGVWEAMSTADPSGQLRQLVPVRIGDVRLDAPFADRTPVDLVRLDEVRAAEALLRGLDLPPHLTDDPAVKRPRFPGAVPPIWNVPTRNAAFTGRNAVLEKLRDQLVSGRQAVVLPQALYGLGGVGKTQIVLEYAYRFMADYDLIWWVPAEQSEMINPALAELAGRLGIRVGENIAEAAQAALDRLRLGNPYTRWLLVFDNADNPEELERYLVASTGHIVVTSRNQAWSRVAEPLEVDVFTREESVEHLLRRAPGLAAADASDVAKKLGDLPLAIEQAGAWLAETAMPAADYLRRLDSQLTEVLTLNPPADYPEPVAATWNVSIERLKERSPAAVKMLELCAVFGAEPISMNLIYGDEMVKILKDFDDSLREKLLLGQVTRELGRFALAKVDQGSNTIQVHRLVQAVIRSTLSRNEYEAACHEVHHILVGARPRQGDTDDPENWPRYGAIWPHLGPSHAVDCTEEETRHLLIDRVRYLWKRGELDAASVLGEQLQRVWAEWPGENDRQTLFLRFHLANVLRSQGRYSEARDQDTQILAKQQEVLPPDHPHSLMTAGGLAADLRGLGDFDKAFAMDRDTYDRFKELFGEDHPRTLMAANNLAVSLRLVGKCYAARDLDNETLNKRRSVLGPDHPYTLFSASNFARDLREAGDFKGSAELLRATLDRYRQVLGDDFLETLRTAKSLAVSLRKMGEPLEAKLLAEETHDRYLRLYGGDLPGTLSCALELASSLAALDQVADARDLCRDVVEGYTRNLGDTHPYTLAAANNLMTYLRGTNALMAAVTLGQQTFHSLRGRLGDDHPFTLSCAVNLANCLADLERLTDAYEIEAQTLPRLVETLGPDHPDTLACKGNLAITARATGRSAEAREGREKALAAMTRELGEDHPDTLALREWRRVNRELEPQPS